MRNKTRTDWWKDSVMGSLKAGWLDGRPWDGVPSKRLKALGHMLRKMDEQTQFNLPLMTIFAPWIQAKGQVKREPAQGVFVYLPACLEFDNQKDVDHTVAHELAHVVLGHGGNKPYTVAERNLPYSQQPWEVAANTLAAAWGFPTRKRGRSRYVKIIIAGADAVNKNSRGAE
jgi:hypothetical protein